LRQHQPFIYPRSPTPDLLDEIATIKRRIEQDAAEDLGRDVKLGRGGIREIEFVVQTLQFIHGGRQAFLQETSTLSALQALSRLELIPRTEVLDLDRGYRFLRQTEHRLQIEAEQQTHTVPRDSLAVERLARSLGFESSQQFSAHLQKTMQRVRSIFDRVVTSSPTEMAQSQADLTNFRDEKAAARSLADLLKPTSAKHVAPRTKQVFAKLRPTLLGQIAMTADPDATLNQFVRFVEAYGLRGLLFELLSTNPTLLQLILKLFDRSRFAADLLIRRPQLLEEITRDKSFNQPRSIPDHLDRLRSFGASAINLDPIRAYRQRQTLRIMMRDVLDVAQPSIIFAELSDLAEACVKFTNELLGGESLTIVALGKFGGRELNYGADLDVVFIGEDTRAAQNLITAGTQPSAEGMIAALDARLRPDGEKGALVAPLAAYESYYRDRAQLWEIQALTRARQLNGSSPDAYIEVAQTVWRKVGQERDLFSKIDSMLDRIHRERSSGAEFRDFKTGVGGIIEAEFLVQALQMRAGVWEPNWDAALKRLRDNEVVSKDDADRIAKSYRFLRRIETALRRFENKNVSALPATPEEQARLSKWLDYKNEERFAQEYQAARETIHTIYERYAKARVV